MRSVILLATGSLDGCIARLNGNVDFLHTPKDYSVAPFFRTIDTAILGRKTYDVAMRMDPKAFGKYAMTFYVMSRTQPPGARGGVEFVNEAPAALVARIRKQPGKNIWLMGGGELAREFLKEDLVDEIHLGIVPTLLGEGIPLFPCGFPQREFELIENKAYSQGLVALKYKRTTKNSKKQV